MTVVDSGGSPQSGVDTIRQDNAPVSPDLGQEVYAQLRRIARRHLSRWGNGVTVSPTTMVHEAWLRLSSNDGPYWQDRAHFMSVASRAMRQLLVDKARRRMAVKRGGNVPHVSDGEPEAADEGVSRLTVLAVDQALTALARHDPALERVVECRFFGGLSNAEAAEALGRSVRSIERDWARARAYLLVALGEDD